MSEPLCGECGTAPASVKCVRCGWVFCSDVCRQEHFCDVDVNWQEADSDEC